MTNSAPKNLTELVTRVLDQLSVSSWLPALTLVGGITFTAELRRLETADPSAALHAIGSYSLGGFVTLGVAVLLTALLTQAFAFQAIRLLEGCWGGGPLTDRFARLAIDVEARRRARLRRDLAAAKAAGHQEAVDELRRLGVRPDFVNAVAHGYDAQDIDPALVGMLHGFEELRHVSPSTLRRIEQLEAAVTAFPTGNRLLPTRLGNTLRSYMEQVDLENSYPESFFLRHLDDLPAALRDQHDRERTRLDLYCTLKPTFGFLAILSFGALASAPGGLLLGGTVIGAVELALASLCYRAAIASAHRYGAVIIAIGDTVGNHVDLTELPEDDPGGESDAEMAVIPPTGSRGGGLAEDDFDPWDELQATVDRMNTSNN